jgi:ABC-type sugar transport system permease subunit
MAISLFKKNEIRFGLILGFLLPLVSILLYYYWKIYPNTWTAFLSFLKTEKRLLSSITVICLLLNIALFTAYVNTRRDETAKGIFAITLIYAIASLLVKFLG